MYLDAQYISALQNITKPVVRGNFSDEQIKKL